nr:hypothetical protein [Tanacetum cinerariifolium]GEW36350.1 hypothetical protein [Tanacetum cinerariifolium]
MRRLKSCSNGSKNLSSSNYDWTRGHKRQKLSPTFGTMDHDDRYRDDPIRSLGLKIEIPEFIDIPDKLKVKLVAIKLRQHASLWWDHVNKRRRIEGKSKVINEFDKHRMRFDVVEEKEQVVARFLGVLKPEIANIVSLQPYWTYTNVCRLALKVKKQIKAKSRGSTSRFIPPTRTAPPKVPKATTPTTSATGPIYDTKAELDLDKPGDELVYPDRGEALVIQRVLNVMHIEYKNKPHKHKN